MFKLFIIFKLERFCAWENVDRFSKTLNILTYVLHNVRPLYILSTNYGKFFRFHNGNDETMVQL